jgi:WD40 repeat protein
LQDTYKYWAFISYSHRDKGPGEWLHKSLEAYRVAKPLQGRSTRLGPIPARLRPVFRDREELAASPDLGERIEMALRQSRYLIVVCSPAAAISPWVNKEIAYFKSLGRDDRILSLIAGGKPYASDELGNESDECFPAALRFQCGPDGQLLDTRAEPLAADMRADRDGRHNALLKLIAGMLEAGFDDLRQRHLEERNSWLRKVVGASLALVLVFAALAIFAFTQQRLAEQQRRLAEQRSRVALSRQLAVQSGTLRQTSPDLPLLLSLEATFAEDTVEARRSLFEALVVNRRPITLLPSPVKMLLDEMAISRDGRTLVTGGRQGQLVFWDLAGDTPRTQVEQAGTGVNSLSVSEDGRLLAVAESDGTIAFWDLASRRRVDIPAIPRQPSAVDVVAFGPGNRMAFGYTADESIGAVKVHIWDVEAHRVVISLDSTADGALSDLAFSPDGRTLASSAIGGDTTLWDVATGRMLHSSFLKDTGAIAFSPDGQWLASGSWSLVVRKAATFDEVTLPLPDAPAHVAAVRFAPDGRFLASASSNGNVVVWDLESRTPLEDPFQLKLGSLNAMVLAPDGRTVYAGNADGQLAIVSLDAAPLRRVLRSGAFVGSVRFSAATGELAWTDGTGAVNLQDASGRQPPRTIPAQGVGSTVFAISPDGATLVRGDTKGWLSVWDVKAMRSLTEPVQVKGDRIDRLVFSPDGRVVAVIGLDREVMLWDVQRRAAFPEALAADSEFVRDAVFSSDGSHLFTVGDDGVVIQWDWRAAVRIGQPFDGMSDGADALALSPDGVLLAVGGYDNRVTLWNATSRVKAGVPLVGHTNFVRAVAFSPDGRFLASGGDDGVAILWDVVSRQAIAEFRHGLVDLSGDGTARMPRAVNHVSFSPDGATLAADGPTQEILLWDVNVTSWQRQACQRTNRNLTMEEWSRYIGETAYGETCPGGRPRVTRAN